MHKKQWHEKQKQKVGDCHFKIERERKRERERGEEKCSRSDAITTEPELIGLKFYTVHFVAGEIQKEPAPRHIKQKQEGKSPWQL